MTRLSIRNKSWKAIRVFCQVMMVCCLGRSAAAQSSRIFAYTVNAKKTTVQLVWKNRADAVLSTFGQLRNMLAQDGRKLLFSMNAGMYQEDQSPLGLFIAEGRVVHPLNTRKGAGNFYLNPNGVFYVAANGTAGILTTEAYTYSHIQPRYATQSGPMLLTGGRINPLFTKGSKNLNIRNGVGILQDGSVVFAITESPVSFYDFAAWFKARGCREALYLDGAISGMWSTRGAAGNSGGFGVMIGITSQ